MLNKANEALQIEQHAQQINGAMEVVMGNAILGVSHAQRRGPDQVIYIYLLPT